MPVPGSVWAPNTWDVDAWAANTWQSAGEAAPAPAVASGAVFMRRGRMRRHGALAFALLLCVVFA